MDNTDEEIKAEIATIKRRPDFYERADLVARVNQLEAELIRRHLAALSAARIAPAAQTPQPIYPQQVQSNQLFVIQIKVITIDGTKIGLSPYRGFRNMVKAICSDIGLSGFVWRVPIVHGRILARGTSAQLDRLLSFVRAIQNDGFILGSLIEKRQDFNIVADQFVVVPSLRPKVATGEYSDKELDDVVSTNSADMPVGRSPYVNG